jgi:hypothetical protein
VGNPGLAGRPEHHGGGGPGRGGQWPTKAWRLDGRRPSRDWRRRRKGKKPHGLPGGHAGDCRWTGGFRLTADRLARCETSLRSLDRQRRPIVLTLGGHDGFGGGNRPSDPVITRERICCAWDGGRIGGPTPGTPRQPHAVGRHEPSADRLDILRVRRHPGRARLGIRRARSAPRDAIPLLKVRHDRLQIDHLPWLARGWTLFKPRNRRDTVGGEAYAILRAHARLSRCIRHWSPHRPEVKRSRWALGWPRRRLGPMGSRDLRRLAGHAAGAHRCGSRVRSFRRGIMPLLGRGVRRHPAHRIHLVVRGLEKTSPRPSQPQRSADSKPKGRQNQRDPSRPGPCRQGAHGAHQTPSPPPLTGFPVQIHPRTHLTTSIKRIQPLRLGPLGIHCPGHSIRQRRGRSSPAFTSSSPPAARITDDPRGIHPARRRADVPHPFEVSATCHPRYQPRVGKTGQNGTRLKPLETL